MHCYFEDGYTIANKSLRGVRHTITAICTIVKGVSCGRGHMSMDAAHLCAVTYLLVKLLLDPNEYQRDDASKFIYLPSFLLVVRLTPPISDKFCSRALRTEQNHQPLVDRVSLRLESSGSRNLSEPSSTGLAHSMKANRATTSNAELQDHRISSLYVRAVAITQLITFIFCMHNLRDYGVTTR